MRRPSITVSVAAGLALLCVLLIGLDQASAQTTLKRFAGRTLVVQTYGGGLAEAEKAAYYEPFELLTGAKIKLVESTGETPALLKAQVDSNNIQWDLITGFDEATMRRLAKQNLLERLDLSKIPGTKDLVQGSYFEYGVADQIDAIIVAYSTRAGVKPLSGAKDFFDVKNFPGPRAVPNWGDSHKQLIVALLADGVPRNTLFPLDLQRVIKVWTPLKPSIELAYQSGNQMVQALITDRVTYCFSTDGRMYQARESNPNWTFTFNGGYTSNSFIGVVKGSKNLDLAYAFLEFTTDPKQQAIFIKKIGYSAPNPKAREYLPEAMRPFLSTNPENRKQMIYLTPEENEIVAENQAKYEEAWTRFLSQ